MGGLKSVLKKPAAVVGLPSTNLSTDGGRDSTTITNHGFTTAAAGHHHGFTTET